MLARYDNKPEAAESLFRKLIRENSYNNAALKYGLGISLLDQKKLDEAQPILDELLKSDPKNLFYIDTYTDLLIAQKKAAEAVTYLAELNNYRPNNQVITLNYANAALEAKQYELAENILKSFLLEKPDHSLGKQLLTDAYKKQENSRRLSRSQCRCIIAIRRLFKSCRRNTKSTQLIEPNEL